MFTTVKKIGPTTVFLKQVETKTGLFSFQMRSDELKCMEALEEKCTVSKWWMPLVWATSIILEARKENRFRFVRLFLTHSLEIGMNHSATFSSELNILDWADQSHKPGLLYFLPPVSHHAYSWRMLKAPPLKSSDLHLSVIKNRPNRGPLICSKIYI